MPYFVYKIAPPAALRHRATWERHQDTRAQVQALRQADPGAGPTRYRLIFAGPLAAAQRLLSRPRDARVIGED